MDTSLANSIATFIATFAASHAWIAGVLMILTVVRAVNKPLMSLIHSVDQAAGLKDFDAKVTAVEQSKVYTYFCYFLDYAFSIKVGTQTPIAQAAKVVAASNVTVVPASTTNTPAA